MKTAIGLVVAAFLLSVPVSCKTAPAASTTSVSASQVHECASCKEKVTWLYGHWPDGAKGIPTGKKVVVHECTGCGKTWSSAVADSSTCTACVQATSVCPTCGAMKKS